MSTIVGQPHYCAAAGCPGLPWSPSSSQPHPCGKGASPGTFGATGGDWSTLRSIEEQLRERVARLTLERDDLLAAAIDLVEQPRPPSTFAFKVAHDRLRDAVGRLAPRTDGGR